MQGWPFISVIATAGEFLVDLLFQIRWQRDVHGGRRLQTGGLPRGLPRYQCRLYESLRNRPPRRRWQRDCDPA